MITKKEFLKKNQKLKIMKKQTKEVKPLTKSEISALPAKARNIIKKVDSEDEEEESEGGKIQQILQLFTAGVPAKFIVRLGYNKSTVYRQTRELTKFKKAPAMSYYGFELYEARLQRVMKSKGVTRDEAANLISELDINL